MQLNPFGLTSNAVLHKLELGTSAVFKCMQGSLVCFLESEVFVDLCSYCACYYEAACVVRQLRTQLAVILPSRYPGRAAKCCWSSDDVYANPPVPCSSPPQRWQEAKSSLKPLSKAFTEPKPAVHDSGEPPPRRPIGPTQVCVCMCACVLVYFFLCDWSISGFFQWGNCGKS